jgi:hypothetical protein
MNALCPMLVLVLKKGLHQRWGSIDVVAGNLTTWALHRVLHAAVVYTHEAFTHLLV